MKKLVVSLGLLGMLFAFVLACNPAYTIRDPFEVSFNAGRGLGSRLPEGVRTDDYTFTVPGKRGFEGPQGRPLFKGWLYDGKVYKEGEVISNITGPIELTAVWDYGYLVRFSPGEGYGRPRENDIVAIGAEYTLPYNEGFMPPREPEGRVFAGWNVTMKDAKSGKNKTTFLKPGHVFEKKQIVSDVDVVAQWSEVRVLYFDKGAEDATGFIIPEKTDKDGKVLHKVDELPIALGREYSIPANDENKNFSYTRHKFVGWSVAELLEKDGKKSEKALGIKQPGDTIIVKENMRFTAQWVPAWVISFEKGHKDAKNELFDKDGNPKTPVINVEDGKDLTLPPNEYFVAPKKPTGRKFLGWMLKGTTKTITELKHITKDMTLVAKWTPAWYVTYTPGDDSTGGVGTTVGELKGLEPDFILNKESCTLQDTGWKAPDGKTFVGWRVYKATDPTTVITDLVTAGGSIDNITEDYIVKAVWRSDKTFTYKSGINDPKYAKDPRYAGNTPTGSDVVIPVVMGRDHTLLDPTTGQPLDKDDPQSVYAGPKVLPTYYNLDMDGNPVAIKFLGWNVYHGEKLIKANYQPGDPVTIIGNMVAVAQWTPVWNIEFSPQEGSTGVNPQVDALGNPIDPKDYKGNPPQLVVQGASYPLPQCEWFVHDEDKAFNFWQVDGVDYYPLHTEADDIGVDAAAKAEVHKLHRHVDTYKIHKKLCTKVLGANENKADVYKDIKYDHVREDGHMRLTPIADMTVEAVWKTKYRVIFRYNDRHFDYEPHKWGTSGPSTDADANRKGSTHRARVEILGDRSETDPTKFIWANDLVKKPADPSYWNYEFKGWFPKDRPNEAWDFDNNRVYAETILIAKWAKKVPADRAELEKMIDDALVEPDWPIFREVNFIDPSNITDFSALFSIDTNATRAEKFNGDFDEWNTEQVTTTKEMFKGTKLFNSFMNTHEVVDRFVPGYTYNAWNLGNVTTMESMFENSENYNQRMDYWDTSKVTNMKAMFKNAKVFSQPELFEWDTSSVTTMESMFEDAASFVPWYYTFAQPFYVNEDNLSVLNPKVTYTEGAHVQVPDPNHSWDTRNVTNMSKMFKGMPRFSAWAWTPFDTRSVTDMSHMFEDCATYNAGGKGGSPLSGFNKDFQYAKYEIDGKDYTLWDVSKVQTATDMFKDSYVPTWFWTSAFPSTTQF